MRASLASVAVLLLGLSFGAPAFGGEVPTLSWDSKHGPRNQNYPNCQVQETQTLIVAFPAPAGIDSLFALEASIEVHVEFVRGADDWWRFDTGCHAGGLRVSTEFPEEAGNPWTGSPATSLSIEYQKPSLRVLLDVSVEADPSTAQGLVAGETYNAFRVHIDPTDPSCDGCQGTACFRVLPEFTLRHSKGVTVLDGADYRSEAGWWQGTHGGCAEPISVESSSWGRVKSIYR